jgi:hypothetical protein
VRLWDFRSCAVQLVADKVHFDACQDMVGECNGTRYDLASAISLPTVTGPKMFTRALFKTIRWRYSRFRVAWKGKILQLVEVNEAHPRGLW